MTIKILASKFECQSCGTIATHRREIVLDEYLKKIEIHPPKRCACGASTRWKLMDVNFEDEVKKKK
jgi:hypothetical protein